MNILLVEDDVLFALEIERLIERMGYNLIGSADSGEKALEICEKNLPDLLLTDIKLKGNLTGIEVAKELSKKNVPVIFFTAFKDEETFHKALEQVPAAFLEKPFRIDNLKAAVKIAVMKLKESEKAAEKQTAKTGVLFENSFFIKDKSVLHKVPIFDIFMIEAEGNYCTIYTKNKRFVLKNSLKKLFAQLPAELFLQVHRNYAVQIEKIEKVDTHENLIRINNKDIPVGRKYWKTLVDKLRVL